MDRRIVKSSNVASLGHDESSNTLEVEFAKGAIYQYFGVPQDIYEQLMQSHSKEQFIKALHQECLAERIIGSIRRQCLDHVVIGGEPHLRRVLRSCADYAIVSERIDLRIRTQPFSRPVQRIGVISSRSILGELHHQYARV
jgi:hypothetical protein